MYGGTTLQELRSAFVMAEQERVGGLSPHISPFTDTADVGRLLSSAGLTLTTVDVDTFDVNYPCVFSLMHDLRLMGETSADLRRTQTLTLRSTMMGMAAAYHAMYEASLTEQEEQEEITEPKSKNIQEKTIPATFQVLYMIGWKPHESQQQPKKRGTATASLKTALAPKNPPQ
eukprot:TRINITY_DN5801_c0_g1_i3.p1 TRINITY_DN5801_c0_g1~~TRINITY_DN5801_c0_g1_i3.p1  ORF type:complete len:173 (-),score=44.60 TRINITY_DN5801_c0_g1_i3:10-528(-)